MALYNYLNTAQTKVLTEALVPWFQGAEQECLVRALDRVIDMVFDDVDVDLNAIYTRLNILETGDLTIGGNKTWTGINVFENNMGVDRVGQAVPAYFTLDSDDATAASILFRMNYMNRLQLGMNGTGSLFLNTWDDAGVSQGTAWTLDNATRIMNFNVSPTMPTTATGTNTTQGATTAFVNASIDVHEAALAADTGAGLVGYKGTGTGAISRTTEARLRDVISVKDFGAVGDGTTDDRTAIANAAAAAAAAGKALYFPAGNFKWTSTITLSTIPAMLGAGIGNTTFTCEFNGPAFTFNNTADATYKRFGGFTYVGPGSAATNTSSCCILFNGTRGAAFCKFDFLVQAAYAGVRSEATEELGGAGWRGVISWCEFCISARNGVKYGTLLNKGSGTGNSWVGGRCAIGIPGGAVLEVNGLPAASNSSAGINIGDIFMANIHTISETGEASGSHTSALFRGGADSTYRSRIGIFGCQVDAQMDKPLDLSSTGSIGWTNIRFGLDNNVGGNVNLYDNMPAIANSVMADQSYAEWKSNYVGSVSNGGVAYTKDIFKMELGSATGTEVTVVVDGDLGSWGSCIGRWVYLMRAGIGVITVQQLSANINGSPAPNQFALDVTTSGNIATFTLSFTPGTETANYSANLRAVGGKVRIQNARRTF